MTALLPEGYHDRLPPYADAAASVEARVLEAARLHGYERADPPSIEFAEALGSRLKAGGCMMRCASSIRCRSVRWPSGPI
ncbi:ATP phosphoribosyltransferase regulatory subunit [Sphingomonas paucimobilis]|nr:ATP phosphoribosyltransferase regulatory subunit [Sphingomonas paucimobilis]